MTGEVPVAQLHEGTVRLILSPPLDSNSINELVESIRRLEDIRIVLVGGSIKKNEEAQVVVSVDKPISLTSILNDMPIVDDVVEEGGELHLQLNLSSG